MTKEKTTISTSKKSTLKGLVVSDSMDKTVVVEVDTIKSHQKYHKQYRSTKRYKVHDPNNAYQAGDMVEFEACRPMSAGKYHIVKQLTKNE